MRFPALSRSSRLPRAAVMLLALLSAVTLGGAQSASCAMHGLGAMSRMEMSATGGHAAMAGMSHRPAPADAPADTPADDDCCCSCIGDCTMVAPLADAPSAVTVRVASVVPEPRRALDRESTLAPPASPDRLLPFANGPPAASLS